MAFRPLMLEMVDILKRATMMGSQDHGESGQESAPEFRGTTIERSTQEAVVGPEIKGARAVQKDQESAAKK
ncbi:hypothetical protein AB205_0137790 [Aquarana catesbeiana]|uniref:Uncharacterized protein n=1 Tax=Aquarana catesbeiana TaxID=8400 RepID=A0A2G9QGU4_AQUCT|nr:hypothetical protein AB205_0137790 [Aquarana catesbeiana]